MVAVSAENYNTGVPHMTTLLNFFFLDVRSFLS